MNKESQKIIWEDDIPREEEEIDLYPRRKKKRQKIAPSYWKFHLEKQIKRATNSQFLEYGLCSQRSNCRFKIRWPRSQKRLEQFYFCRWTWAILRSVEIIASFSSHIRGKEPHQLPCAHCHWALKNISLCCYTLTVPAFSCKQLCRP